MPITQSSLKDLRQTKKRTKQNKRIKTNLVYLEKKLLKTLAQDKNEARNIFIRLQKALDKAAKRQILPKNTASRKKSRLSRKLK